MKKIIQFAVLCVFSVVLFSGAMGGNLAMAENGNSQNAIEKAVWSTQDATVSESDFCYQDKPSYKIVPKNNDATIYFYLPEFNDQNVNVKKHFTFRIYIEGTENTYNEFRLYTWGKTLIDYAYPLGKWNFVNFDAELYVRDGNKSLCLNFVNAENLNIYLSAIEINDDTYSLENILGGVELYQIARGTHMAVMESYVMVTPDNKVIVMDGGEAVDAEKLLKVIRRFTNKVDAWFISHFHSDHIDAFLNLFDYYGSDNDLVVENLYYDALDLNNPSFNEQESVSRANSINKLVSLQKGKRIINAIQTSAKQSFKIGQYVTMKVLNDAYFGPSGNPGNNASVVYKMETPGESVLFLGDLGDRGDYYLNDQTFRNEMRSCRVVQMAHHGQRGVTDYFYSMIDDIRVCLYAAPKWVFDNDENGKGVNTSNLDTMHTRDLMRERGVRYSFHAIDKDVRLG